MKTTKTGQRLKLERQVNPPNLNPELSVVIPCYNECGLIEHILREWMDCLHREVSNFEIVVVNDGSTDGTGRLLDGLRRQFRELRVIHQLNFGHEKAVRRGYEAARGRFVLQVDSSGRYEPSDFMRMWNERFQYHLILGARTHRLDHWMRRLTSTILRRMSRFLFGTQLRDPGIPFRLFQTTVLRSYLNRLPRSTESVNLALAVLIKINHPEAVMELPVPYRFRPGGKTHMTLPALVALAIHGLLELTRLRFSRLARQPATRGRATATP